ncbi:MAG: anti-sigma factor RsbA family regulatory protein [Solirubrobacteraceae bacterium]
MRMAPHPCSTVDGYRSAGWHTGHMGQHQATDETGHHFHHSALLYAGEDGFLEGTLPFLKGAVAAEEPVLVAVSNARIELLRSALGDDAELVHFADMHVLGSNPARIIPAWRRFLADHAPDERPVRGIGEPIWAGRNDAELTECQRHETLLNVAFDSGQAWRLLCPYDLDALDDEVIEAARCSHPFVAQDGANRVSDAYSHKHEASSPFDGALSAPTTQPQELAFTSHELADLRWFVSRRAAHASLGTMRTQDLVLAVNELATNSIRHGGGEGMLRMWTETDTLLCEVHDRGQITEPLVGRTYPAPTRSTGRGLWVVNHLCDLVQIRSTPTGSVVRVHMRLT